MKLTPETYEQFWEFLQPKLIRKIKRNVKISEGSAMANFFKNMVKLTYNYFLAKLNFKLPAAAWRTEWNHFKISIISKNFFRYLFDAKWQNPFRSARIITSYLEGKNKPIYSPGVDCGDHVVVINSRNISLLGREWKYRVYFHHPGYFKVSIEYLFWSSCGILAKSSI